jgi:hypothetical protein
VFSSVHCGQAGLVGMILFRIGVMQKAQYSR